LLVGYFGVNGLAEVKDPEQPPSGRKLTEDERDWHNTWKGQVAVIETSEDVVEFLRQLRSAGL
jgi:hypothetical protein